MATIARLIVRLKELEAEAVVIVDMPFAALEFVEQLKLKTSPTGRMSG